MDTENENPHRSDQGPGEGWGFGRQRARGTNGLPALVEEGSYTFAG